MSCERQCFICNKQYQLMRKSKDVNVKVRGLVSVVSNVEGWHCSKCDYVEFESTDPCAGRLGNAILRLVRIADKLVGAPIEIIEMP